MRFFVIVVGLLLAGWNDAPPENIREMTFSCGDGRDVGFKLYVNPVIAMRDDGVIATKMTTGEEIEIRPGQYPKAPKAYTFTSSGKVKVGFCTLLN